MNEKALGRKIKTMRLIRGWTQKELAERAGLSIGAISEIERGQYQFHRRSTIEKLVRAFNIKTADLILEKAKQDCPVPLILKGYAYGLGLKPYDYVFIVDESTKHIVGAGIIMALSEPIPLLQEKKG